MFELSLMNPGSATQVRRRLVSLPAAVALHGLVIASVGVAQYWDVGEVTEPIVPVTFVTQAPLPPPAPSASGGGRRPEQAPVRPKEPVPAPAVAQPEDVPDDVPAPAPAPEAPVVIDLLGPATGGPFVPGSVGPGGGDGPLPGTGRGDGVDESVAPADPEPIHFRAGITRPEILERVEPRYTELDRRARSQGTVVVEAVIDEQGRVRDVKVLRGVSRGLDQATVDAVRRWRFRPATLDGRPVKIYYSLTVNFQVR